MHWAYEVSFTPGPGLLSDYEAFLSSMVVQEVDKLPRGIYHTAMRRHGLSTNRDKAIGSVPAFISQLYDKTKQPGLRPALAGQCPLRLGSSTRVIDIIYLSLQS